MSLLSKVLVPVAHVISPLVYMVYEAFVRLINPRPEAIPNDLKAVVGPYFTDVDLDAVTLAMGARIPTGHAGLTLGQRIFVRDALDTASDDDLDLLVHELVHVRQRMRYGRFAMMRRYGVEWARRLSYDEHPMEIEARTFEAWVRSQIRLSGGLGQDG